jgi:uncharacterized protein (TIGR00369 family)
VIKNEKKNDMTKPQHGVANSPEAAGMSGKQALQAVIDGRLPPPPIGKVLSFRLVEVGDGFAAFEGEADAHLLNPLGTVHGGWAMALIDSATGCACHSLLPPGTGYTTIETKVNFSRPILPDTGRVRCEGRVISKGRRIISAQAQLLSADGKVLAHGTSTIMILEDHNAGRPPAG